MTRMTRSRKRNSNEELVAPPTLAPKRVRRMNMLRAKTVSKDNEALYKQNAENSSLLRLPPDVRNRIWGFLLGGKTVHMYLPHSLWERSVRRPCHSICSSSTDDAAEARQIIRYNEGLGTSEGFKLYSDRHSDCSLDGELRNPLPVQILATCRQIHQEAALLPFHQNHFEFAVFADIAWFAKTLFPAQTHAIRSVVLSHAHSMYYTSTFDKLVKSKLRGLTQFTCFMPGFDRDLCGGGEEWRLRFVQKVEESLLQFQGCPIQFASVAVFEAPYKSQKTSRSTDGRVIVEWSSRMERALMSTNAD
ncbi:hypothetical protein BAUCODRAFT_151541 [Baudoinia panamericana UAMH 10762]|uniref:DUF7730 domain-containing protein n=1 Tax=Baudoinia panamericana (strain UAMH 10762) TaxID=717646 RepID=M2MZJ6_BAUPA|nr:uncharacterized protein BAUCODRAFT_151541 [Baudoinia panamericana UAMH 10762]EMC92089.1 hypothetical protein BAUCODRAFT_151541 [Baudoinia panamericana UAMH 10762]